MKFYKELQALIGFRGNKQNIQNKIYNLTDRTTKLVKSDQPLYGNDNTFEFSLGTDGDTYLDFDIYMLKTNAKYDGKRVWLVTELNSSY
jgi:hypothetical protein